MYLRQPALPKLYSRVEEGQLTLRWESPGNLPFPMPVEVEMNGKKQRVQVTAEGVVVKLGAGVQPVVDPDQWLLCELAR